MKRSPKNAAKATACTWYSKYIRMRDAIETTGTTTEAVCATCGKRMPIAQMDASHFVPGRTNGVLFDERNALAACRPCNRWRQGVWPLMEKALIAKYDRDIVERLKNLYGFNPPMEENDYREIAARFREAYNELRRGHVQSPPASG